MSNSEQVIRAASYFTDSVLKASLSEIKRARPTASHRIISDTVSPIAKRVLRLWYSDKGKHYNSAYILQEFGTEYAARFLRDEIVTDFIMEYDSSN